jgi:hypothetical protein
MIEAMQPFLYPGKFLTRGIVVIAVITLMVIFIRAWFQATRP